MQNREKLIGNMVPHSTRKGFKLLQGQKKKKKLWYDKYLGKHREKRYKFIFFKIGHDFALTDNSCLWFSKYLMMTL